jgi:hypothetical protein
MFGSVYGFVNRLYKGQAVKNSKNAIKKKIRNYCSCCAHRFVLVVWQLRRVNWSYQPPQGHQRHPPNGATNVPVNTTITLTFNDKINPGPSYANITLNSPSGAFTKTITGTTLTITPTANLPYDRWTLLTIPANALLNTAGTPMASTFTTIFATSIS